MSISNNPASRLLHFVDNLKEMDDRRIQRGDWNNWSHVFEIPTGSVHDVYRKLVKLGRLPRKVESLFRMTSKVPDHHLYLGWVSPVHDALHPIRLDRPLSEVREVFNVNTYNFIKVCESQINDALPSFEVNAEFLTFLQNETHELIEEISSAVGMSKELRDYLLRQLHLVEQALSDYRLEGVAGLNQAVEGCIGAMVLNRDLTSEVAKTAYGVRWGKVVGGILLLCSTYPGARLMLEDTMKVFSPEVREVVAHPEVPLLADGEQREDEDDEEIGS